MLSRFFRKRQPQAGFEAPRPDLPVEAVGDIHGRADLLDSLPPVADGAVRVLLGDYVDRGPQSREVLERVHARSAAGDWVCLCGNHEEMFVNFLRDPVTNRSWLGFGGLQTLASFGIGGITETSSEAALREAAEAVPAKLSFDLFAWVETLPVLWSSGTLTAVHAGLDPLLPLEAQDRRAMVWGHPDFGTLPRPDGRWIVHGHTIVNAPRARDGVISIDTGAYATGRLTLARVSPEGEVSFAG